MKKFNIKFKKINLKDINYKSLFSKSALFLAFNIIAIFFFVFKISAAYFSGVMRNDAAVNVTYTLPTKKLEFTTINPNTSKIIDIHVTSADLAGGSAVLTNSGNYVVSLKSGDTSTVFCTYDLAFVWDSTAQYLTPSAPLNDNFEYSILGTRTIAGDTTGSTQDDGDSIAEVDLSSLTWTGDSGALGRYAIIASNKKIYSKSSTTATTHTWNISMKYYVSSASSALEDSEFLGHIEAKNVVC